MVGDTILKEGFMSHPSITKRVSTPMIPKLSRFQAMSLLVLFAAGFLIGYWFTMPGPVVMTTDFEDCAAYCEAKNSSVQQEMKSDDLNHCLCDRRLNNDYEMPRIQ